MECGHDSFLMPHVPILCGTIGTIEHSDSSVDAEVETVQQTRRENGQLAQLASWGSLDDPCVASPDTLLLQGKAKGNLFYGGPRPPLSPPLVHPRASHNSHNFAEALYLSPDEFTSQSPSPSLSSSDSLASPSPLSVNPGGQITESYRLVFEFSLSEHHDPQQLVGENENAVLDIRSSETAVHSTPQQAYSAGSTLSSGPQGQLDFSDDEDGEDDEDVTLADKSFGGVDEEPNQKPTKYVIFSPHTGGPPKKARASQSQLVQCEPNENDYGNPLAPCKTCLKVDKNSKKTIHYIPCLRFKLTGITMHRSGSLDITNRFKHTQLVDLPTYGDHRIMLMTQDLCKTPMVVQVRRFRPKKEDDIIRRYIDLRGIHKEFYTAPYCISNIGNAAQELWRYIRHNAVDGLLVVGDRTNNPIVKRTFTMLAQQCRTTPGTSTTDSESATECKEFLNDAVQLWFTMKLGTGTARLCGSDLLGMLPPDDPGYPYVGIPAPRMVVAQMDSIRTNLISSSISTSVLRRFESLITSNNMDCWFTVYLMTFLLLYEVAAASQDRLRYALQNGVRQETRYGSSKNPLTGFVEDMQFGGVMLLAYWHYFKRVDFFNQNWGDLSKSPLRSLQPDQAELLKWTVAKFDTSLRKTPGKSTKEGWEDELYWISHMFDLAPSKESGWAPPKAFEQESPSVRRDKSGSNSSEPTRRRSPSSRPVSSMSPPSMPAPSMSSFTGSESSGSPSSWSGSSGSAPDSVFSTPSPK
ncbi:hypothetical protein B0T25DRAFT_564440 [Lasiosphaeria hispida]|uniref:Uncharacterized protein n=1 Tax=Lasiosphaeria hispida TaxID=260671 RepID=A0AAJ0HQ67_9PEZI|nr:hypothetical protein B0T25DRAFT_564440 [Lasiosphaeria hispida]